MRSPRCGMCGGASRPGHFRTDTHRRAETVRANARLSWNGVQDTRRGPTGSRAEEERVWAEEEARARLSPAQAIDYLIDSGTLPPVPENDDLGPELGRMLTLKEAAAIIGTTPDNLRQSIARGTLKATKMGRDWFVQEKEAERYRDQNRREKTPQSSS